MCRPVDGNAISVSPATMVRPSMMRDRVAFKLFRDMGNAAPRLAHCHLHVNDQYKGLYIAAEPVRKDFARYRWGGDDDGNLFEQDGHGSGAYDWRGTSPGSYVPAWSRRAHAFGPGGQPFSGAARPDPRSYSLARLLRCACASRFSSSGVSFGRSILSVSFSSWPVKVNGT